MNTDSTGEAVSGITFIIIPRDLKIATYKQEISYHITSYKIRISKRTGQCAHGQDIQTKKGSNAKFLDIEERV